MNPFESMARDLTGGGSSAQLPGTPSYVKRHFPGSTALSAIGYLSTLTGNIHLLIFTDNPKLRNHPLIGFLQKILYITIANCDEQEKVYRLRMTLADYKNIFDETSLDSENLELVTLSRKCRDCVYGIQEYKVLLHDAHVLRRDIHSRLQELISEANREIQSWELALQYLDNKGNFLSSAYFSEAYIQSVKISYEVAKIITGDLDDFDKARKAYELIDQLGTLNPFLKRVKERFISFVSKNYKGVIPPIVLNNETVSNSKKPKQAKDPRLEVILSTLRKKGNNSYKKASRIDIINAITQLRELTPMSPEIDAYINKFSRLNTGVTARRISKRGAAVSGAPISQDLGVDK